jgi:signal transduction histidine kinase
MLGVYSGCGINGRPDVPNSGNEPPFTSYREIPGITDDEITVIEGFIEQGVSFVYGTIPSTESFICEDDQISGFTALLCDRLTTLFGIPFIPKMYEWGNLLAGLENGEIDFTGELTATEERHNKYEMTDSIALRLMKYFRIEGGVPLNYIAVDRPVRIALLSDTITIDQITQHLGEDNEILFVDGYEEAYRMLKDGRIDAFIEEHTAEEAFDQYGDVVNKTFYPLIYVPVSMTTQKKENAVIISVFQKALQHGGRRYLTDLYSIGVNEYKQHKLHTNLTDEEMLYIEQNPVIRFVTKYDNFPISFYNARDRELQGIFHDVRKEIEDLTGLRFEQVNNQHHDWVDLIRMLETGEAVMTSELLRTSEREGRFLWADTTTLTDHYALLSKSDFPNIIINEIKNAKVGLVNSTGQAELFVQWFPKHPHISMYNSFSHAFNALTSGEVDMVMGGLNHLYVLTHYRELPGYKANLVFDYPYESKMGYNVDEPVLRSIIDKAMRQIDVNTIVGQWTRRTYDYRGKMAKARQPWLFGAIALLGLIVVILIVVHFKKRRTDRIVMEAKMKEHDLAAENAALDKINRMKNEMMENLTHEMRTPLAVMSAYAQYTVKEVQQSDITEQTTADLKLIVSEAKRLADMSSGVLEAFNNNKLNVDKAPFFIESLLREVERLAVPMMSKNRNTLNVTISEELPLVFGRAGECTQVILNLLSNAASHTKDGTVTVSAEIDSDGEQPMLAVTVSDNGEGIPAALLPHVFDRRRTGQNEGTGLGLPICKEIVQEHGGEIIIRNGDESGVVARFTLPLAIEVKE